MIISDKYKFIYLDVPKTASLSLDTIFTDYCGGILNRPDQDSNLVFKHSRTIPEYAKNYTKITSVRNPYERMVSFYFFEKKKENITFDRFIDSCLSITLKYSEDEPNGLLYRYFPAWKFLAPLGYDIVLRKEYLKEDLKQLSFLPKNLILPNKNQNPHDTWEQLKNSEREEKIKLWAGKDFELFGYKK